MAIKLKVQSDNITLKAGDTDSVKLKASVGVPIYPEPYTGETEITPTEEAQTVPTAGLMMQTDIVVNPIPSNYGLITWDGTTITVS